MIKKSKGLTTKEKANEIIKEVKKLNKLLKDYASREVVYQVKPQKVTTGPDTHCIQFECTVYEKQASCEIENAKPLKRPPAN